MSDAPTAPTTWLLSGIDLDMPVPEGGRERAALEPSNPLSCFILRSPWAIPAPGPTPMVDAA